jgi:hypothetical protein
MRNSSTVLVLTFSWLEFRTSAFWDKLQGSFSSVQANIVIAWKTLHSMLIPESRLNG